MKLLNAQLTEKCGRAVTGLYHPTIWPCCSGASPLSYYRGKCICITNYIIVQKRKPNRPKKETSIRLLSPVYNPRLYPDRTCRIVCATSPSPSRLIQPNFKTLSPIPSTTHPYALGGASHRFETANTQVGPVRRNIKRAECSMGLSLSLTGRWKVLGKRQSLSFLPHTEGARQQQ